MTTATATKTTYPYVSAPAWQTLRKRFRDSPPKGAVTASYLQGVLNFKTTDAGKSLASSLKRLGLIDAEGKLTPRAYRWRFDDQYKEVCDEILDEVYPQTLRDVFGSPDVPLQDVQNWFHNDMRKGTDAAYKSASLYKLLLDGDASKLESESSAKATSKATKSAKASADTGTRRSKPTKTDAASASGETQAADQAAASAASHDDLPHRAGARSQATRTVTPSIHLDFQIHIAPDSSAQVVDQIFESMAKHLRSLLSEAGE